MAAKERIKRVALADPRSSGERAMALVNKVTSGNRKSPARSWDNPKGTPKKKKS